MSDNVEKNKYIQEKFKEVTERLKSRPDIEGETARHIGQFLYYHTQIELSLDKLIFSLIPEIDMTVLKIDSYNKKLSLIKSLTPNSKMLGLFSLLEKINSVRNIMAHQDPANIDFSQINTPLINLFKSAFKSDDELCKKLVKVGKGGDVSVATKIIASTNLYLKFLVEAEELGKAEDKALKSFEALRKFSSLYIRRRFSILTYQVQTGINSSEAPEEFKEVGLFSQHIEEIRKAFFSLFEK